MSVNSIRSSHENVEYVLPQPADGNNKIHSVKSEPLSDHDAQNEKNDDTSVPSRAVGKKIPRHKRLIGGTLAALTLPYSLAEAHHGVTIPQTPFPVDLSGPEVVMSDIPVIATKGPEKNPDHLRYGYWGMSATKFQGRTQVKSVIEQPPVELPQARNVNVNRAKGADVLIEDTSTKTVQRKIGHWGLPVSVEHKKSEIYHGQHIPKSAVLKYKPEKSGQSSASGIPTDAGVLKNKPQRSRRWGIAIENKDIRTRYRERSARFRFGSPYPKELRDRNGDISSTDKEKEPVDLLKGAWRFLTRLGKPKQDIYESTALEFKLSIYKNRSRRQGQTKYGCEGCVRKTHVHSR